MTPCHAVGAFPDFLPLSSKQPESATDRLLVFVVRGRTQEQYLHRGHKYVKLLPSFVVIH